MIKLGNTTIRDMRFGETPISKAYLGGNLIWRSTTDDLYYGIEWDETVDNGAPHRIGSASLHASVPLQSAMRRCLLLDDGTVNYYLDENDSTLKADGTAADLTGADGQYMVELPDMYVRFETEGTTHRCMMSTYPLGGFTKWGKDYVSAVEATLQRSTQKLSSVVNMDADYRGGGNQADWDALQKSQLGKPATAISLTNFRNYARKRGSTAWNCYMYQTHKKLYWLFATEYCTFNSQAAYNANLTESGYRQGGLGAGVTTLNGTKWSEFSGYYPVIPCGITTSLGNNTGVVSYTMPTDYDASGVVVSVPSYRGVENIFGHIWKWTDGCKCKIQSEAAGGKSYFYVCDDPAGLQSTDYNGYVETGEIPRTSGYVKTLLLGEGGEIMPQANGGSASTYFYDHFYSTIPESGEAQRGVLCGGSANDGALAGLTYAHTYNSLSYTSAFIGSRLCYIPT